MLVPTSDSALVAILQHYDDLAGLLHIASPPPDVLRVALDKWRTLEAARNCNVPIPETHVLSSPDELCRHMGDLHFPLIAKPGHKIEPQHSFKCQYFREPTDLQSAFEASPDFGKDLIFQEYVAGEGVGLEILLHRGEPIMQFQHRRLKEFPSSGGVGILVISEKPDPVLADYALKLLRHIAWEGVAMVEFRHDRNTGKSFLIEISGRFWGSVALSYHAGLNPGFYQWQIAHGDVPAPATYKVGVRARWTPGYVLRLHDLACHSRDENGGALRPPLGKDILNFFLDLQPFVRDMVWSIRDPLPAITEMAQTARTLVMQDCRQLLRRTMPSGLRRTLRNARSLEPGPVRSAYIRMALLRWLKIRRDVGRQIPSVAKRILFVCHGNIIRSPMAEALMKRFLEPRMQDGFWVSSAGLAAKSARKADERAVRVGRDFGVSLDRHRAVPLTSELVQASDVIFVMDCLNEAQILGRYRAAGHKTFLLGAYSGGSSRELEIPDPYLGGVSDIKACYELVARSVQNLVTQI